MRTLAVKDVTSDSFANRHAQIDEKANACNAHSSIALVGGSEIGIVMVVVAAMAGMLASLCNHSHGEAERRRAIDGGVSMKERGIAGRQ
jgi:hypothetical protein